ncbi:MULTISPECIES: S-4TM family putative pore-forming effector [Trichocoleus]|uniref:S-4TM family putative pore-forming effector n=1 Tax=Trichocoleus desertorum GB2-A4 TaxID=2933944 RepID=A0ABV0JFI5_9CYAN|nr:S-4TM family putative pore-forming effector [Trichocoleus sp. FACHB-46]MBD1864555.1 hypothetical protein [Trichocoleus sp. FACHB-46]
MNSIPQEQVLPHQIDRLAAQQYFYSAAKRIQAIHIFCSVPLVLIGSLIAAFFPQFSVYTALWGLSITFLDVIFFSPYQKMFKKQAAKIQEIFDCDVLKLEWASIKIGRRPDEETVLEAASHFKKANPSYPHLTDWYAKEVGQLPIEQARIICQRTNCWWDSKLRRNYANWVVILLSSLVIALVIIGLIGNYSLESFILRTLVPLTPAFLLGTRQYSEHIESANSWQRLKEYSEQLWEQAISKQKTDQELTQSSRCLQDEIYEHRCKSPLIFDWLYHQLRPAYSEQTDRGVKAMVEDALRAP